jgi:IclR family pca regulon transcriptional regulator
VRNAAGDVIAALSLSVLTTRMTRDEVVEQLLPEMEQARRNFAMLL